MWIKIPSALSEMWWNIKIIIRYCVYLFSLKVLLSVGGWRDYIASWATPLKTTDIFDADVTFSINFCSYYVQPTIGRFISVASLHLLTALVGGKKRRTLSQEVWSPRRVIRNADWRPKHLATQSGGEQHISEAAKVVGGVMCCKTVILWLRCHGNSVSMFQYSVSSP